MCLCNRRLSTSRTYHSRCPLFFPHLHHSQITKIHRIHTLSLHQFSIKTLSIYYHTSSSAATFPFSLSQQRLLRHVVNTLPPYQRRHANQRRGQCQWRSSTREWFGKRESTAGCDCSGDEQWDEYGKLEFFLTPFHMHRRDLVFLFENCVL